MVNTKILSLFFSLSYNKKNYLCQTNIGKEKNKEVIMCIAKSITRFISNGGRVLRDSSRGEYNNESEFVSQLKKELFVESNKMDDKIKLKQDRTNIEKDVRNAWEKLKLSNG